VACARALVEAEADVAADCDGCPALVVAICTALLPGREAAAAQLVQLLLDAGADPMQRDDYSRLPLHWAAELGLVELAGSLLQATAAAAAQLAEQMAAAAAADEAAGHRPPALETPSVLEMQVGARAAVVVCILRTHLHHALNASSSARVPHASAALAPLQPTCLPMLNYTPRTGHVWEQRAARRGSLQPAGRAAPVAVC
jgi:hypothetical protein